MRQTTENPDGSGARPVSAASTTGPWPSPTATRAASAAVSASTGGGKPTGRPVAVEMSPPWTTSSTTRVMQVGPDPHAAGDRGHEVVVAPSVERRGGVVDPGAEGGRGVVAQRGAGGPAALDDGGRIDRRGARDQDVVALGGRQVLCVGRALQVGRYRDQRAARVADQRAQVPLPQPGPVPGIWPDALDEVGDDRRGVQEGGAREGHRGILTCCPDGRQMAGHGAPRSRLRRGRACAPWCRGCASPRGLPSGPASGGRPGSRAPRAAGFLGNRSRQHERADETVPLRDSNRLLDGKPTRTAGAPQAPQAPQAPRRPRRRGAEAAQQHAPNSDQRTGGPPYPRATSVAARDLQPPRAAWRAQILIPRADPQTTVPGAAGLSSGRGLEAGPQRPAWSRGRCRRRDPRSRTRHRSRAG